MSMACPPHDYLCEAIAIRECCRQSANTLTIPHMNDKLHAMPMCECATIRFRQRTPPETTKRAPSRLSVFDDPSGIVLRHHVEVFVQSLCALLLSLRFSGYSSLA